MPDGETPAPFLDTDPPHWAAGGLAWMLLAAALVAAGASVVITLPDTVRSPFVLVPAQGTDPVRAPRSGAVLAVRAREGAPVAAGAALFIVSSERVGDRSAELRTLETQLAGAEDSRANARQRHESQRRADEEEGRRLRLRITSLGLKLDEQRTRHEVAGASHRRAFDIQQNEIDILGKEVEFKRTHAATARELVERMDRRNQDGMFSWLEYNNRKLEAIKLVVEIQQLERSLESARLKLNQLRAEHETFEIDGRVTMDSLETERREAQAALARLQEERGARDAEQREIDRRLTEDTAKARIRVASLRDELAHSRGSELTVGAPCPGTVLRLLVKAPGAVVQEGDLLAELACGSEGLHAEVNVPPSGMGRIKPGQVVRLLYDAFPYQRYGIKHARVRWVSPASVTVKDQPVFRVLADLEETSVQVRDERRPLVPGLGGRADIVVGRRSLISYAFEPIRQLRETISDRGPR